MTREQFIQAYKRRGYLHFDTALPHPGAAWSHIERFREGHDHGFMPFLGFTLTTIRLKRERPAQGETVPRRLRNLILKPKHRPIKIASHRDAAVYSFYGMDLGELYEQRLLTLGLESVPTAFRRVGSGRCNIDHAKEVFDFIEENRPCVALGFDVEKFFDRLSHIHLRNAWASLLGMARLPEDHYRVFRSLTRFTWVERKHVFAEFGISVFNPKMERSLTPRSRICDEYEFRNRVRGNGLLQHNPERNRGIPQGAPMSAILSNIYMLQIDEVLHAWACQHGGLYRRYCDDIVLVVPPERVQATEFLVRSVIHGSELALNESKTERVVFEAASRSVAQTGKSLPYLGFVFDGNVVRLRQSSLDRYYGKMRKGVKAAVQCQKKESRNTPGVPLQTRKLFLKYSHLAKSQRGGISVRLKSGKYYQIKRTNFITYGIRAAEEFESTEIRKQLRGHWQNLRKQIRRKELR
jgi:hypothetical protein